MDKRIVALGLFYLALVSVCSAECISCKETSDAIVYMLSVLVIILSAGIGIKIAINPSNKNETGLKRYSKSDWFWLTLCVMFIIVFGLSLTMPVEAGFVGTLPPPNMTANDSAPPSKETLEPEPEKENETVAEEKEEPDNVTSNETEEVESKSGLNITHRRVSENEIESCINLYQISNPDFITTGEVSLDTYQECIVGEVKDMEFPKIDMDVNVNVTYQEEVDIRTNQEIEASKELDRQHDREKRTDWTNIAGVIFVVMLVSMYLVFTSGRERFRHRGGGPPKKTTPR